MSLEWVPIGPWHRCFAWLPVITLDNRLLWLRSIERRRYQSTDNKNRFRWQYQGTDYPCNETWLRVR